MTTTEKKAEPAPSKSLDEMIENFHALLKRSPGEGVAIDKADAVDILADLISYQKSSSENAALDELRANVENEIKAWETRCSQHPHLLHEVTGIVAAWLQMRQMIDAAKGRQQQKMKQ